MGKARRQDNDILEAILDMEVPITTEWTDFTPSIDNAPTFTVSNQFKWRRNQQNIEIKGGIVSTGTGAGGLLELQLPAAIFGNVTLSTETNSGIALTYQVDGEGGYENAIILTGTDNKRFRIINNGTGSVLTGSVITSGDQVFYNITAEITEWQATQTVREKLGL